MRTPSAETQNRTLRRELAEVKASLARWIQESNTYRARTTKAEQETAEWKRRFDALLERTPKLPGGAEPEGGRR